MIGSQASQVDFPLQNILGIITVKTILESFDNQNSGNFFISDVTSIRTWIRIRSLT